MNYAVAPPRRGLVQRIEDGLWAFWPGLIWPRTPSLGLMFSDGGWLRAWPGLGLLVPLAAFVLGAYRGGWRPEDETTYSFSTVWMCVFLAVALIGCAVAFWLWFGFVLGDLFVFDHSQLRFRGEDSLWDGLQGFLIPHFVSYFLLAAVLLGAPLIALLVRGSVSGLLSNAPAGVRAGFAAVAALLAAGVQAGLWTQAFPLMIRPLWTWSGRVAPPVDGIQPIQEYPWVIGGVAAGAAAVWAIVSFPGLARIVGRRYQPIARTRPRTPLGQVWTVLAALLRAALITLLLGGLIPEWRDGLIAFGILTVAFLAQTLLLPATPVGRWWTARLPFALRLLIAGGLAWLIAWQIGRTAYDTRFGVDRITADSFAPLLYATVAAIACMALLLPTPRRPEPASPPDLTGRPS